MHESLPVILIYLALNCLVSLMFVVEVGRKQPLCHCSCKTFTGLGFREILPQMKISLRHFTYAILPLVTATYLRICDKA